MAVVAHRARNASFYSILLIVAIVFTYAVDTSICERGFALMNNLKTARRSRMADALLRTLMTICTLGKEWADPTKIPVDKIAEEWRSQSSKGRYESAMWREAGLEEPGANAANGGGIDRNVDVAEAEVDNLNTGGFFARYGREPNGPRPTVIPPHTAGGAP